HTEMAGLADDADALRLDRILDRLRHLLGEPLLNLKAAREGVHNARKLAQAEYFILRQVGDVHFAEKRQQMVLAKAEEFDILDDHHLVVIDRVERLVDELGNIGGVAAGKKLHRLGYAG